MIVNLLCLKMNSFVNTESLCTVNQHSYWIINSKLIEVVTNRVLNCASIHLPWQSLWKGFCVCISYTPRGKEKQYKLGKDENKLGIKSSVDIAQVHPWYDKAQRYWPLAARKGSTISPQILYHNISGSVIIGKMLMEPYSEKLEEIMSVLRYGIWIQWKLPLNKIWLWRELLVGVIEDLWLW